MNEGSVCNQCLYAANGTSDAQNDQGVPYLTISGIITLALALIASTYGLLMDTTVEGGLSNRIYNTGLVQQQTITIMIAGALYIGAIILIVGGQIMKRLGPESVQVPMAANSNVTMVQPEPVTANRTRLGGSCRMLP